MADIILPQVNILSSASSSTNLLVESNGEIHRLNIGNLSSNGSTIDADTLQGNSASYFATTTNLNNLISTNTSEHSTFNSQISTFNGKISTLETNYNTLNNSVNSLLNPKTELYSNMNSGEKGSFNFSISQSSLSQYKYIEILAWTYIEDYGWWYEPVFRFDVTTILSAVSDGGWQTFGGNGYIRELEYKNNRIYISGGYWTDGEADNYVLVPEKIWGIK